jgi:hypothetical protein
VGLVAAFLSYWLFATVSPRTEPTAQVMAEQAA